MSAAFVLVRILVDGVETERRFAVERHFRGVSVRDEAGGLFGIDVAHAAEELCDRRGWGFVGVVEQETGEGA